MAQQFRTEDRARSFAGLLEKVDPASISAHPYCVRYLQHLKQYKEYYLAIYEGVFDQALLASSTTKEEIMLVDLGAGNGLLGIFAKYCGFQKVYLADIDNNFIESSRQLATAMNITVDGFIAGEISDVQRYFLDKKEKPSIIVGTDVIEHIYDLGHLFETICRINPGMVTVFTTASNPVNFFKTKQLKKLQLRDELEGSKAEASNIDPTTHASYFSLRKIIIETGFPQLSPLDVMALAKATRGLNKKDIEDAIQQFLATKKMPVPSTKTNTCNPLTGSWTERILSLAEYRQIYEGSGFRLKTYNGFYNQYRNGVKGYLNKILNTLVAILGKNISPFIGLVGSKK